MSEKVIYFSLNETRPGGFNKWVRDNYLYEPKYSFELVENEFKDPRDLINLLDKTRKDDTSASIHVIIDYISCAEWGQHGNYPIVIRDIIMCYPEVQFLFDETCVHKNNPESSSDTDNSKEQKKLNFMSFLFVNAEIEQYLFDRKITVLKEYHQFKKCGNKEQIKKEFRLMLKGKNNLYDASNLRCAIKQYKYDHLYLHHNYEKLQTSRRDHLAVTIDEEYHQNAFNAYCLYANGFRVKPVCTHTEFDKFEELKNLLDSKTNEFKTEIDNVLGICPGYVSDLKHEFDSNGDINVQKIVRKTNALVKDGSNKSVEILSQYASSMQQVSPVLILRDYDLQFLDEDKVNYDQSYNTIDYIRGAVREDRGWKILDEAWKKNFNTNTSFYFISKGGNDIQIDSSHLGKTIEFGMYIARKRLMLKGIEKPVSGIYKSFHNFPEVKARYKDTRYTSKDSTFPLKLSRTDSSGHSCPLDIYAVARSMIERAKFYHLSKKYRLAAIVAGEALEVLNGFHESLMLKAYYLQAVAENAMAMELLGGDERRLVEDTEFRMKKIKEDVKRMIPQWNKRFNMLYNIFNDCRHLCIEKEHFDSADEILSEMVKIGHHKLWNIITG